MAKLKSIEWGFHRILPPVVPTHSMHAMMRAFTLNAIRLRDADEVRGGGITFDRGALDAIRS